MSDAFQVKMASRNEVQSKSSSAVREVFSGPERNSMCQRKPIDASFTGECMYNGKETMTTSVEHMFRDAPGNKYPKHKASWVGATGWGVHNQMLAAKSKTHIRKSEFRQEAERKAASYPKII